MYSKRQKASLNSEITTLSSFWDDCIDHPSIDNPITHKTQIKLLKQKLQCPKKLKNNNSTHNLYSSKFFCNFPNIYEDQKNYIMKQKKYKASCDRLQHLYEKGIEKQKYIIRNQTQNDLDKINKELKSCTFKPKINKISKNFQNKLKIFGKNIYIRDKNRQLLKQISQITERDKKHTESIIYENECTFRPQINDQKTYNEIFNKSKSLKLLTDRDNIEFVSRYAKARDEYLLKRFIKLPHKDESYDNSYIELCNRFYGQKCNDFCFKHKNIKRCASQRNFILNKNISKQSSNKKKINEEDILREKLKEINLEIND